MQQKIDLMSAESPVEKIHPCMQYQFFRKKLLVNPAVPNSDTHNDAPVTVYHPIQKHQGSPKFLGEDHISYRTTVRGRPTDSCIMCIFGIGSIYQNNTFFVNTLFFIIGKMYFASGWNGFAGRIWPAGRSVENPDIDYEEEWWQHTTLSESNTNGESSWFNSVIDTDTIFWAGTQLLDGQQEAPANTVLPQPPKLFMRNPTTYFSEVDWTCVYAFGMLPGFLENLLESRNLVCSATAATRTALDIIQLWFNYFCQILAYTLSGRLSIEMPR